MGSATRLDVDNSIELDRDTVVRAGSRRLRATIEYDGTDFVGWQCQPAEHGRTVQGTIEQALAQITGEATSLVGAGRTDAGVHATGQVAHFDTHWSRSLAILQRALLAVLPVDVAVVQLAEAPPGFHARYSAVSRTYVYTLFHRPARAPLVARTSWHVAVPLDIDRMASAAQTLLGRHDFRGFGRPMREGGGTIRTVNEVVIAVDGSYVTVHVSANAFLRHMMRRVVFALIEVGRGRLTSPDVVDILMGADPHSLHGMAPPHGLCLVHVAYPET